MVVNDYEKTYASVYDAVNDTKYLVAVVSFLRQQTKPVTCAEIGKAVFGEEAYTNSRMKKSYSASMGQILRHLRKGKFIKIENIAGNPIEIEDEEFIYTDAQNNQEYIKVHDDAGNEYIIQNPKFNYSSCNGHWQKVKKTITPTIKVYYWIA